MNVYKFLIFSILFFISYDNASAMKLKGERWKRFESLFADRSDTKRVECFKYLFNWRNPNTGNSLLHHVAQNNDIEFVAGFIGMGWLIDEKNAEGKTPHDLASEAGHDEVCEFLEANFNLFVSILLSNMYEVQRALDTGADPNVRNKNGFTPLLYAAYCGSATIVGQLLGAGARVGAVDGNNRTSLFWAARWGHVGVVRQLLAARADKTIVDHVGRTALDIARSNEHAAVIALLEVQSA